MKKIVFLIFGLFLSNIGLAQEVKEVFHNYYYDQKRSLFESLPLSQSAPVVLLGDSITNCGNWDELFPNQNIINRGISGDITLGVLDRLNEIVKRQPKKVFIMIGINDVAINNSTARILENYQKILTKIKTDSPQTIIYIQSLLPTNGTFTTFKNHQGKMDIVQQINKELATLALKNQVHFINLFPHFLDEKGQLDAKYTNDGLHLLGTGYQLWARLITEQLKSI